MLRFFLDGPLLIIGMSIYSYNSILFILPIIDKSCIKRIDKQALTIKIYT